MKTLVIRKNGEYIATALHAKDYFARLRGLLGRSLEEDGGLMLTPCNSIHTIGMRYAIDAVYLDRSWRVLRVDEALKPGRVLSPQKGAKHILELRAGRAKQCAITRNDILEVTL
jgi:uncharacterized protein